MHPRRPRRDRRPGFRPGDRFCLVCFVLLAVGLRAARDLGSGRPKLVEEVTGEGGDGSRGPDPRSASSSGRGGSRRGGDRYRLADEGRTGRKLSNAIERILWRRSARPRPRSSPNRMVDGRLAGNRSRCVKLVNPTLAIRRPGRIVSIAPPLSVPKRPGPEGWWFEMGDGSTPPTQRGAGRRKRCRARAAAILVQRRAPTSGKGKTDDLVKQLSASFRDGGEGGVVGGGRSRTPRRAPPSSSRMWLRLKKAGPPGVGFEGTGPR